ncbi:MAG TPA: trypsin-like serine protease, partial [Thermomicrobiales bacterium]|nr:trypsin-like serine protease [Thermomicrobiales bacterium]
MPTDLAIAKPRRRHGVAPQIINGQPVEPGQDRFVVALLDATRGTSQFDRQFCGGSIIGRRYVLTAAHCMEDEQAANLSVLIDQVALDAGGG